LEAEAGALEDPEASLFADDDSVAPKLSPSPEWKPALLDDELELPTVAANAIIRAGVSAELWQNTLTQHCRQRR
jgi:hypothetical protein